MNDLCSALEQTRRRAQLSSLALGDSSGLLIAGAGRFAQCEELCALAAHCPSEEAIEVRQLSMLGQTVLLSAPGPIDADLVADLARCCDRIFGRRPSQAGDAPVLSAA